MHFLVIYLLFDTVYEKKFLDINEAFGDLKMISKDCYLRKLKSLTENIVKIIATVVAVVWSIIVSGLNSKVEVNWSDSKSAYKGKNNSCKK